MFPKSALAFLTVSLTAHAFFVAALTYPSFVQEAQEGNSVQIEYVESPPAAVVAEEKKALPAPYRTASSKALPAASRKKLEPKPIRPQGSSPKPAMAIGRSEDILADPAKGKIFAGYFARIKEKIQNRVQWKYAYENIKGGRVALFFVLDSDGQLESVSVLEKQSVGDRDVREFAMQCVRDSAPFGRFPADLNLNKISFNLTVLFEEV